MHLNYAEIFGVESLSLNKHFSKPIHSNAQSNFDAAIHIPKQLKHDLVRAIESLNEDSAAEYSLIAQKNPSYGLIQTDISISNEGLNSDDKKQLWQALINTFKVKRDDS